jgi:WhiB family transcriptional regulator, redox-sensing transcriptional regulator
MTERVEPMCRTATTAVAAGAAAFEADAPPSDRRPGAGPDTPGVTSQVPRPRRAAERAAVPRGSAPAEGLTLLVASLRSDLPCAGAPELFFAESADDVEMAKDLCRECTARASCLAGALERREPCGVWGGELFQRGAIVPRKRPRGRPRKTDVAAERPEQEAVSSHPRLARRASVQSPRTPRTLSAGNSRCAATTMLPNW